MSDVLIQRLVAASHGRVPVDTLSCPEWGYETVQFAARGMWSPALQAMSIHEVAADFGRCCACGCEAVEEPMFLAPQTVFQAAADFLLRPLPATVKQGGVAYACGQCGSDQMDFALKVKRDPIAADWIVESIDNSGHYCLACGCGDCDPAPRPMTSAEHGKAKAELKRLATEHIERVRRLRKVLEFVSGVRR